MHSGWIRTVCCSGRLSCHARHPHVHRILDTRLWKHYLPPTTVADGNNISTLSFLPPPSNLISINLTLSHNNNRVHHLIAKQFLLILHFLREKEFTRSTYSSRAWVKLVHPNHWHSGVLISDDPFPLHMSHLWIPSPLKPNIWTGDVLLICPTNRAVCDIHCLLVSQAKQNTPNCLKVFTSQ